MQELFRPWLRRNSLLSTKAHPGFILGANSKHLHSLFENWLLSFCLEKCKNNPYTQARKRLKRSKKLPTNLALKLPGQVAGKAYCTTTFSPYGGKWALHQLSEWIQSQAHDYRATTKTIRGVPLVFQGKPNHCGNILGCGSGI